MIILDVEASGLHPASYPIEIAWQHRSNPKYFDSFLIKPVATWTYWDPYAETHLHHISRATLENNGISVLEAVLRLNNALNGQTVYSDAADYDRRWIAALFSAAGAEKTFTIRSLFSLVPPSREGAYRQHMARSPTVHRALEDVRQIVKSLNYVCPEGC